MSIHILKGTVHCKRSLHTCYIFKYTQFKEGQFQSSIQCFVLDTIFIRVRNSMGGVTSFVHSYVCTINDKYHFLNLHDCTPPWCSTHCEYWITAQYPNQWLFSFTFSPPSELFYSLAASGLAGASSPLETAVIWLLPSSIYFYKKKRTMECISTTCTCIPKLFPFINNSYREGPALWLL